MITDSAIITSDTSISVTIPDDLTNQVAQISSQLGEVNTMLIVFLIMLGIIISAWLTRFILNIVLKPFLKSLMRIGF
jgi:hypothetical protein